MNDFEITIRVRELPEEKERTGQKLSEETSGKTKEDRSHCASLNKRSPHQGYPICQRLYSQAVPSFLDTDSASSTGGTDKYSSKKKEEGTYKLAQEIAREVCKGTLLGDFGVLLLQAELEERRRLRGQL